jgi:hypothetical protein
MDGRPVHFVLSVLILGVTPPRYLPRHSCSFALFLRELAATHRSPSPAQGPSLTLKSPSYSVTGRLFRAPQRSNSRRWAAVPRSSVYYVGGHTSVGHRRDMDGTWWQRLTPDQRELADGLVSCSLFAYSGPCLLPQVLRRFVCGATRRPHS